MKRSQYWYFPFFPFDLLLEVLDSLLRIIIFCYIIIVILFFIFSNFQAIYLLIKVFPVLQVWSRRKLLKKGQKKRIPATTHCNWKTAIHQQFPGSILQFYIYSRNYKKIHLKGLPFSSQQELMIQTKS